MQELSSGQTANSNKLPINSESITLILLFLVTTGCVFFASFAIQKSKRVESVQLPERLPISAQTLLSHCQHFYRNNKTDYILVSFTDYQCPVCKKMDKETEQFINSEERKVNYAVLNFPLSYHKNARNLAIYVTSSTTDEEFWRKHNATMRGDSDEVNKIVKFLKDSHSKNLLAEANKKIDGDMKLGRDLHILGTPTYFLCGPKGSVYSIKSFEQAKLVIAKGW